MTDATANTLLKARLDGQLLDYTSLPTTEDESYSIQQAIVDLNHDTISGIKIGATNAKTQAILGLTQPFFGPVFSNDVHAYAANHNTQVPLTANYTVKIETEFVIGLRSPLTGTPGNIDLNEVMAAIAWIAPGFELIGSRIRNPPEKPGLCAIADSGGNHSVVLGRPDYKWKGRDWQKHMAKLSINGEQVAEGHSGDSIAGNPIGMLHWLLNFDRFAGKQITAEQFIFCGTCTAPVAINAGDQLLGNFGDLGDLRITCTD